MTIGKLSGQCDFGQKGQSYCNQRGQSCVAKRVKVAWLFQRLLAPKKCTKENLSVFSDAAPVIILHSPHIPYNKLLTTSSIYNKTPKKIFMGKSIPTFFQKKQRIIIPGTNRSGSNNLLRPPLISYKLSFSAYGQSFQQSPIERLSRCFSSHPKPIESPK